MKNYKEFSSYTMEEMKNRFPELEIQLRHVSKLQGASYDGIEIRKAGTPAAATFDLMPAYDEYVSGEPLRVVMDRVADACRAAFREMPRYRLETLADYGEMRKKLVFRLVSVPLSGKGLAEIPHEVICGDMAAVCAFSISEDAGGSGEIVVTDQLMRSYGITREELFRDAEIYAPLNRPSALRSLADMVGMEESDGPGLKVAGVRGGVYGAAVLRYPGFLQDAAEKLGGDFYILPSSVHEVILLQDTGDVRTDFLNKMVRTINWNEVSPAERLSDQAYHYDAKDQLLETALEYDSRMADLSSDLLRRRMNEAVPVPERSLI